MPGQKAAEGLFPVCIEVSADVVSYLVLHDAALFTTLLQRFPIFARLIQTKQKFWLMLACMDLLKKTMPEIVSYRIILILKAILASMVPIQNYFTPFKTAANTISRNSQLW